MTRLYEYDHDSILVGIVPQACAACGDQVSRVRLSLETVIASSGELIGIQSVATTQCCDGRRGSYYPAEHLARLLDHLQSCPNHKTS